MKLFSTLLLLSSIVIADPSLTNIQHPKQVLTIGTEAIEYPRDYNIRYRGVEAELMGLDKVIKALFGDDSIYLESLEFSAISYALQGKWWYRADEDREKMSKMRTFYCKNYKDENDYDEKSKYCYNFNKGKTGKDTTIQSEIDSYLATKEKYTEAQANKIAVNIMTKKFQYEGREKIEARVVDYRSGRYQDFPVDVLFSTIYQQNAMIYGDTVVVLKPFDKRSIDLSYYNGLKNDSWGYKADAGEYITPGYIKADEILGVHLRLRGEYPDKIRNRVGIKDYKVQKHFPITYAFYKYNFKGENYILIFDGKRGSRDTYCMAMYGGDFAHCAWEEPLHLRGEELILGGYQGIGERIKYVPNLIGIIASGTNESSIKRPDELMNKFSYKSSESLDKDLINTSGVGEKSPLKTINSLDLRLNGKKTAIKFFLATE